MSGRVEKKKKSNKNLRHTMVNRLKSARLRFLNDQMYNNNQGKKVLINKQTFKAYHESLEEQQQHWTTNPLDNVIKDIRTLYGIVIDKNLFKIADFGCGTAKIAQNLELTEATVHSFDLVALNDKVTACDMSHTRLPSESIDVAVYCLSLMTSDCTSYINEGRRILKKDGLMFIVEVTSRLNEENFTSAMKENGFVLRNKIYLSDKYFTYFKFVKSGKKKPKASSIVLETCKYKKR